MKTKLDAGERAALREVATTCLCNQARNAARSLTRFYDRHYAESGIEPTQLNVLVAIGLSEPVSVVHLAGHLGLERTTLTRNLGPLQRDGLVVIKAGEDARQRLLSLTETGRRTLRETLPHWQRAQKAAIAVLGKANFVQLSQALSLADKFNQL